MSNSKMLPVALGTIKLADFHWLVISTGHLEDHPRTRLRTMVIVGTSPKDRVGVSTPFKRPKGCLLTTY